MAIDENVKKNWAKVQAQHNQPVNAIGVPIKKKDERTLKVWRAEGIDQFMKK